MKCAEFISLISDMLKRELTDVLHQSRYMSIIIDWDTDAGNKECELIYARVIDGGKPVNRLVGQQELEHAHAKGIFNFFCNLYF